jgi:site-specific DNA recombinase
MHMRSMTGRFLSAQIAALLWRSLAHIGEITYRGEVHRGEHEPILARELFEAVQAKRAANAVARDSCELCSARMSLLGRFC